MGVSTLRGQRISRDIHLLLLARVRRPEIVPAIERAAWKISFNRAHIVGDGLA